MFKLLKELTDLDEVMKVFESQTMLLVDGDAEAAIGIVESASIETAKIVKGLKSSDWSPTPQDIQMAAAVQLLADSASREAISDSVKGGSASIQKLLLAAGENEKANQILTRLVKQYGQSLPAKIQKEFEEASTNEEVKKQLTMKYGKLLDVIGRVQSGVTTKKDPEKSSDMKDWFK